MSVIAILRHLTLRDAAHFHTLVDLRYLWT